VVVGAKFKRTYNGNAYNVIVLQKYEGGPMYNLHFPKLNYTCDIWVTPDDPKLKLVAKQN
jgi:hypothetical protein